MVKSSSSTLKEIDASRRFLWFLCCIGLLTSTRHGCHSFSVDVVSSPPRYDAGSTISTTSTRRILTKGGEKATAYKNPRPCGVKSKLLLQGSMQVWLDGRAENVNAQNFPYHIVDEVNGADMMLLNLKDGNHFASEFNKNRVGVKTSSTCLWQKDNQLIKCSRTVDGTNTLILKGTVGAVVSLDTPSGQDQAMAALGSVEWVWVTTTTTAAMEGTIETKSLDWQMIPAENLIAAAASSGTKVAFSVDKVSDVGGLARALELGVDALCVSVDAAQNDSELWNAVLEAKKERNQAAAKKQENEEDNGDDTVVLPKITIGSCWRRTTKGTVIADRVCVDLVQNLLPEEGCWIGSSAKLLALVLSEAAASQYVPTRPFRINAGPVHSYILLADDTTKYLSELEAADQVAVFNAVTGKSRSVAVGRLKQEVRPCVLVELELGEAKGLPTATTTTIRNGQVFLQQAETVRLGKEDGGFVRVTELVAQTTDEARLQAGKEQIWLRVMTTGTHIGTAYAGKVNER